MNPQYEKQLEASVRRELDALGELSAPPALAKQILRTIEQRQALPWYRQSWAMWPLAGRATSLAGLLAAFGGLCYGGWELTHAAAARQWFGGWFADAAALWRTVEVLADTVANLFGQVNNSVIFAGAALLFAACVACLGLGTVYVRLALRPTVKGI